MNSFRFLWSWGTDYASYKLIYGILLVLQIVLNFTIPLVAESEGLYAVWISLLVFCEGAHFTLVPNVLKKIFGGERGTEIYGILYSYVSVMAIIQIFMQNAILTTEIKSYNEFFYIDGGLSAFSLILLLTLFSEEKFTG